MGSEGWPSLSYFNSRPCERGDTRWCKSCTGGTKFQFTPLREGRRTTSWTRFYPALFQFTPLREGRRQGWSCPPCRTNFNSRPCERGDHDPFRLCPMDYQISIHAPARGATYAHRPGHRARAISIHAPARGATAKLNKISVKFTEIIIKTEWEFKQYSSYGY